MPLAVGVDGVLPLAIVALVGQGLAADDHAQRRQVGVGGQGSRHDRVGIGRRPVRGGRIRWLWQPRDLDPWLVDRRALVRGDAALELGGADHRLTTRLTLEVEELRRLWSDDELDGLRDRAHRQARDPGRRRLGHLVVVLRTQDEQGLDVDPELGRTGRDVMGRAVGNDLQAVIGPRTLALLAQAHRELHARVALVGVLDEDRTGAVVLAPQHPALAPQPALARLRLGPTAEVLHPDRALPVVVPAHLRALRVADDGHERGQLGDGRPRCPFQLERIHGRDVRDGRRLRVGEDHDLRPGRPEVEGLLGRIAERERGRGEAGGPTLVVDPAGDEREPGRDVEAELQRPAGQALRVPARDGQRFRPLPVAGRVGRPGRRVGRRAPVGHRGREPHLGERRSARPRVLVPELHRPVAPADPVRFGDEVPVVERGIVRLDRLEPDAARAARRRGRGTRGPRSSRGPS